MGPGQFSALPLLDMENSIRVSSVLFDWFSNPLASCCPSGKVPSKKNSTTLFYHHNEETEKRIPCEYAIRFTPLGFIYDQDNVENDLPKFNSSTYGGVAAIDHEIANHTVFGGSLAYTRAHLHWSRKQGHADVDTAYLAPYVLFDTGVIYTIRRK